jgi:hypothetical protein
LFQIRVKYELTQWRYDSPAHVTKLRNQLARRSINGDSLRSRYIYSSLRREGDEPQYVVSRTMLGEFALHWTAEWFAGLFSVTDLPAEWVAFVRASIHGPWDERAWSGGAPFAGAIRVTRPAEQPAGGWTLVQPQLQPFGALPMLPP